jgi:hypothetical protein
MLTIKTKNEEVGIGYDQEHTIAQVINSAREELVDKRELPDGTLSLLDC